jgi:hypothetical protein
LGKFSFSERLPSARFPSPQRGLVLLFLNSVANFSIIMNTDADYKQDPSANRVRIPSVPNLVSKEALAALAAGALVCVLSAILDAPLEGPADAGGIPAHSVKAPWIFLGIQQLLRFLPTGLAGIILPLTALAGLAVIPLVPSGKRRFAAVLFFGIVLVSSVLTLWGQIR